MPSPPGPAPARAKVALIGGGSLLWAVGFVRQFIASPALEGGIVAMMDTDANALHLTGQAAHELNRRADQPLDLQTTQSLDEALTGADFVIVSISTGGLEAMRHDIAIPERYGIYHTVGDTVGPGGWARAVRNIPVFYDLGERMSRLCPNAWFINVTNPLTVLTRVPHKYFGIRSLGMCPGLEQTTKTLSALAGAGPDAERAYVATGIDHGSFITGLYAGGMDVLGTLKEKGYCRSDGALPADVTQEDGAVGQVNMRAAFAVWRELGYMPGISDRHLVENFPWFIHRDGDGRVAYGVARTPIEHRIRAKEALRDRLEAFAADPDRADLGALGHGEDPIGAVTEALLGRRSYTMGANYPNVGQIPQAPQGAVVETRCRFDAGGVHPEPSPMPHLISSLVLPTIHRQEAAPEIALNGTFDELAALVLSDPACARLELTECRGMVAELMRAHESYIRNRRLIP